MPLLKIPDIIYDNLLTSTNIHLIVEALKPYLETNVEEKIIFLKQVFIFIHL